MTDSNNNLYYTTKEVAEMLKVHNESVRRWIRQGDLPAVKLGGKYIRISSNDLQEFINLQHRANV